MTNLESFRSETRDWLEANCPTTCRGKDSVLPDMMWGGRRQTFNHPDHRLWFDRLVEKGYTVPTWAPAYGGAGLTAEQNKVLQEEMARIGTRSMLFNFGIAKCWHPPFWNLLAKNRSSCTLPGRRVEKSAGARDTANRVRVRTLRVCGHVRCERATSMS